MIRERIRTKWSKFMLSNRLALGIVTVMASAIVGSAGVAAAQSQSNNDQGSGTQTITSMCKQDYIQFGYTTIGQCVSHKNGHGHGYGGSGNNGHGNAGIFAYINSLFASFLKQFLSYLSHFSFKF